jgi:hypothetical protein
MDYQPLQNRREQFLNYLLINDIGLAYFFGSRKELGPRLLAGEDVQGAFVTQYRRQVLTLYGDWHSWWP